MSNKIKEKLEELTPREMPEFLLPHIELFSSKKACVEGCKGILEYNSNYIKLNCKNKTICFKGFDLSLGALYCERVTVSGKITDISLEG